MPLSEQERTAAVDRIRKLMAVGQGKGATEAEIETYLRKARQMMDQFAIDESEVLNKNEDSRKAAYESMVTLEAYKRAGSIDMWDRLMANVPKFICDVGWYTAKRTFKNARGNWSDGEVLRFYGLPRDCEVAAAMYVELLATMRAMCRFSLGDNWKSGFQDYCEGFVHRLITRAHKLKQQSTSSPESGSTAIILLKDQLLKKKRDELGLGQRKTRTSNREVNEEAWGAGASDANNVSLGTNQLGAKRKEIE